MVKLELSKDDVHGRASCMLAIGNFVNAILLGLRMPQLRNESMVLALAQMRAPKAMASENLLASERFFYRGQLGMCLRF